MRAILLGPVCLSLLMASGCQMDTAAPAPVSDAMRVVSLDYCADQFVLKFVDRDNILAVSPDAAKYFSYMREAARGLPTVRPTAEEVLLLQPTVVVRSYGGGPYARRFFSAAGVEVVQLGFPASLDEVKHSIRTVAAQLDAPIKGQQLVNDMERRLRAVQAAEHPPVGLYVTPGGVTTGPGSLVHELLRSAGIDNYETRRGWRPLPLENLVYAEPDLIAAASFGQEHTHVDAWTLARHPRIRHLMATVPRVELAGAWTSCGGWFLLDAIEALAGASAGTMSPSP